MCVAVDLLMGDGRGVGCWGGVCIGHDSDRAGSQTLEKSSRRDRDRVCAKFESSRRFRGSNMNPKKKSRRCLGLDSGLDLAISRFIYSFALRAGPTSSSQLGLQEQSIVVKPHRSVNT